MARTVTVEGDLAAADTLYRLTTQGSVTAPSLVVPAGMTKITSAVLTFGNLGAADDGMMLFFVRLGGSAILNGESQLIVGGTGNQTVQAGSDAGVVFNGALVLDNLDIAVSPSDTIDISAEGAGVDAGTGYVAVTLVYA